MVEEDTTQGASRVDIESLYDTFCAVDVDRDGYITRKDLRGALDELGLRSADESNEEILWRKMLYNDKDGDGKISFEEFKEFALWRISHLKVTFEKLDKDGNGYIDAEEVHMALKDYGLDAPAMQVKQIVDRMDKNADGRVNFDEFRDLTLLFPSTKISKIFDHAGEMFIVGYMSIPKNKRGASSGSPLTVLLSGGAAGLVSRTLTAPADRLKVVMQANSGPSKSIGTTAKDILKEGGLRSFWRGNATNVLKIMPESAVKFFAYERIKSIVAEDPEDVKIYERLLAGSSAGVIAQSIVYPFEVIKNAASTRAFRDVQGHSSRVYDDCQKRRFGRLVWRFDGI